jgi:hypothetical protein
VTEDATPQKPDPNKPAPEPTSDRQGDPPAGYRPTPAPRLHPVSNRSDACNISIDLALTVVVETKPIMRDASYGAWVPVEALAKFLPAHDGGALVYVPYEILQRMVPIGVANSDWRLRPDTKEGRDAKRARARKHEGREAKTTRPRKHEKG